MRPKISQNREWLYQLQRETTANLLLIPVGKNPTEVCCTTFNLGCISSLRGTRACHSASLLLASFRWECWEHGSVLRLRIFLEIGVGKDLGSAGSAGWVEREQGGEKACTSSCEEWKLGAYYGTSGLGGIGETE